MKEEMPYICDVSFTSVQATILHVTQKTEADALELNPIAERKLFSY